MTAGRTTARREDDHAARASCPSMKGRGIMVPAKTPWPFAPGLLGVLLGLGQGEVLGYHPPALSVRNERGQWQKNKPCMLPAPTRTLAQPRKAVVFLRAPVLLTYPESA